MKFEYCFGANTDYLTANLDGNTTEHVTEMELYIIVSTLEKNLWWNQTLLITKYSMQLELFDMGVLWHGGL